MTSLLLSFPPGPNSTNVTYRVFLVNDDVVETREETFTIVLMTKDIRVTVDVQQSSLEVTIIDDDGE